MLKKYFKILSAYGLIAYVSVGQISADVLSDRLDDVKAAQNEADLVSTILGFAIPVATFCLLGLGVYAGYNMITSQGNPEKLNEAREVITNAVLGFALIGLSVAVLLLIQNVLQIPGI